MAIDIGSLAINRDFFSADGTTWIDKNNPANASGSITSIEIWAHEDITGLIVGTFYTRNGNTLKCRDSEAIPGTITAGEKVTKTVSIAVKVGDYIGCYFTLGRIDRQNIGVGFWYKTGKYIDPGDEADYTFSDSQSHSLYGTGEEEAPPVAGRSFGYIIG